MGIVMTTARSSWRIFMGWLLITSAALGQAPQLGDPNCPNCQKPNFGSHPAMPVAAVHGEPAELVEAETPVPVVKIKVRGPACAIVGQRTEYRIKVENCSPADAHNVVVKTTFPASVKVVSASPQAHASNPDMQWNLGTLPGYGCHDLVLVVVPVGLFDIKSCTRVSFEHGQCVTSKVMAFAPAGSAEEGGGKFPGGPGGVVPHDTGIVGPGGLYINVTGPDREVPVGQPVIYKVTVGNRGNAPLHHARVLLSLNNKDPEFVDAADKATSTPFLISWPAIEEFQIGVQRSFEFRLKSNTEGRHCFTANLSASAAVPVPNQPLPKLYDVKQEFCTNFVRGLQPAPNTPGGMTMEMSDRDDPILMDGRTSYVIAVKNQSTVPLTNIRLKAKLPALLDFDELKKPAFAGAFKFDVVDGISWVEFDKFPTLPVGESVRYEVFVKAKGKAGDARFQVQWRADQLMNPDAWITDEESTAIVPDEETRVRMISRKKAALIPILLP